VYELLTTLFMSRSTLFGALQLSALCAIVLTSGCTYVKGLYGGKTAPAKAVPTATAPVLYAPERHYTADISAARAYVGTQLPASQRMALIDVRDATEYRLGHPEGARHLPYPRIYQQCQPHPSGAPQAQIRSDDGSQCRYGVVPGSEVRQDAAAFWQAVQEALPYKDAPVAVLCRTGACAADVANLLARPDLLVDKGLAGKGYQTVYAIREGFVGEPMVAVEAASGKVLSTDKKGEKFTHPAGKQTFYSATPVALDVNQDGQITQADWSGWRNFLGLPYVLSMQPNLLNEAAQNYYDKP
jgi:rhodanese-related sulfurtransferase